MKPYIFNPSCKYNKYKRYSFPHEVWISNIVVRFNFVLYICLCDRIIYILPHKVLDPFVPKVDIRPILFFQLGTWGAAQERILHVLWIVYKILLEWKCTVGIVTSLWFVVMFSLGVWNEKGSSVSPCALQKASKMGQFLGLIVKKGGLVSVLGQARSRTLRNFYGVGARP